MPLDEAARITLVLAQDVTSMTHAALQGWRFPMSREAFALLDLHDLLMRVHGDPKQPFTPHAGRPFDMDTDRTTTRRGDAAGRTREEVIAILAEYGHGIN